MVFMSHSLIFVLQTVVRLRSVVVVSKRIKNLQVEVQTEKGGRGRGNGTFSNNQKSH